MSCECLDPICLKVGVNPCEATKLPINLEYGDYILEFSFGGSSMNIEIEVNEEYPNVVIASGRLNEDMTYILRVWDKDANEYLSECYQLTTFLVRGVSNNGGLDPSPTPTPSDLDNLEFTELTATPDYDNNEITISATIIDNEGVPQTQSTTFQVPLHTVSLSDAERISQSNGQWMQFIDNAGVSHSVEILEPYAMVSIGDHVVDYPVDNDMVGRVVFWQGKGWFQLFDSDPSTDYIDVLQSNYDNNYWWAEVSFGNELYGFANITNNELANRWKIASSTHSNNTIPKVTATGELGSSNISDSGTIVTVGGNGLTIPNTTTTGATTNGLIKYNTTANEYRGVRSGVELKFLQTGDVTMNRFVWVNSATGTDTRTGLSVYSGDRPFATLQAAVTACASGDTIVVMNSTLTENITVVASKGDTLTVYFFATTFNGDIQNIKRTVWNQGSIWNGRFLFPVGSPQINTASIEADRTCTWNINNSLAWSRTTKLFIRGWGTISNTSATNAGLWLNDNSGNSTFSNFNSDASCIIEDINLLQLRSFGYNSGYGTLYKNIDRITLSSNNAVSGNSRMYFDGCTDILVAQRMTVSAGAFRMLFYFNNCNVRNASGNLFDYTDAATVGILIKAINSRFYSAGNYIVNTHATTHTDAFMRFDICVFQCAGNHAINFTANGYNSLSMIGCFGTPASAHNNTPTNLSIDYKQVSNINNNSIW